MFGRWSDCDGRREVDNHKLQVTKPLPSAVHERSPLLRAAVRSWCFDLASWLRWTLWPCASETLSGDQDRCP